MTPQPVLDALAVCDTKKAASDQAAVDKAATAAALTEATFADGKAGASQTAADADLTNSLKALEAIQDVYYTPGGTIPVTLPTPAMGFPATPAATGG